MQLLQVVFLRFYLFGLYFFNFNFKFIKYVKGNLLEFGFVLVEIFRISGVLWFEGGVVDEVIKGFWYED